MNDIEYYMALPYEITVTPCDVGLFAEIKLLPGCMTQADSWEELGEMIEDAKRGYLEVCLEDGCLIAEPANA